MKFKNIFLSSIFIIMTSVVFGQIPKGAESIKIKGDSSTKEEVIHKLIKSGFNIKEDGKYGIKTEEKKIKWWFYEIRVSIIKDEYIFSIYLNDKLFNPPTSIKCKYKGSESNGNKVGFTALNDLVSELVHYDLYYE